MPSLQSTLDNARAALLSQRNGEGYWEGELSNSSLSTATAIVALHCVNPSEYANYINRGIDHLLKAQNDDGGWGDTSLSFSNISTSVLCWAALNLLSNNNKDCINRANTYITKQAGSTKPDAIANAITARYGKDRTFAVPILMMCAICGCLGEKREAWKRVTPLPYELTLFPHSFFAALRLPVVSYALPALIAIGYARARKMHHPLSRFA